MEAERSVREERGVKGWHTFQVVARVETSSSKSVHEKRAIYLLILKIRKRKTTTGHLIVEAV